MDNMMMDGVLSLDSRPAEDAMKRVNTGLDESGKKHTTVLDRQGREWKVYGDTVVRVSGQSKTALDRLISSMEKQSQLAGKSGVERLIVQRDQLIQRWAKEKSAVDAINASYAKMIDAEKAAGGSGFNARYAFFGLKDIAEGRTKFAVAELANELMRMKGTLLGVGLGVTAIAAIGIAAYEAIKAVDELRTANEKLRGEFGRLAESNHLENAELDLANTKLENTIAKLQHKPGNGLKEALEEATVAAGKLADKLDASIGKFYELLKSSQTTGIAALFTPNDKDIAELVGGKSGFGGMRNEVFETLRNGGDPTAALSKYRALVADLLRHAQFTQARQTGATFEGQSSLNPYAGGVNGLPVGMTMADIQVGDYTGRIEKLKALLNEIDFATKNYGLEQQNAKLQGTATVLQQQAEAGRLAEQDRNRQREFERGIDRYVRENNLSVQSTVYDLNNPYSRALAFAGLPDVIQNVSPQELNRRMEAAGQAGEGIGRASEQALRDQFRAEKFDVSHVPGVGTGVFAAPQSPFASAEQQKLFLEFQGRMAGLQPGLSPEQAAQRQLQSQLRLIAAVRDQEISLMNPLTEQFKISEARNKADLDAAKARYEYEEKIGELQRKQFEEVSKTSAGLFRTLFTNPRAFPGQLRNTVQGAVLNPITEGLGNMTANLITPFVSSIGSGLRGLFGGTQDPVKLSTDLNTQATVQNTAALGAVAMAIGASSGAAAVAGGFSPAFSGGMPNFSLPALASPTALLGPGGTSGFAGPVSMSGGSGGGILGRLFGAVRGGGAGNGGGFGGLLSGLKSSFWNEDLYTGAGSAVSASSLGFGGKLAGVLTSKGAASLMLAGGMPLAMAGLTGSRRGTWAGIGESTAGGALTGAGIGTMIMPGIGTAIGAGVGAAAGFTAGVFEKLFGVESPENEAHRLILQTYGVNIPANQGTIKQIVAMSRQYGNSVSMTIRTPEARKLIELYAQSTGQKSNLFLQDPVAAHLQQSGGVLGQALTYNNGTGYTFGSSSGLPTLGNGPTIPTQNPFAGGPTYVSLHIGDSAAADFMGGQIVQTVSSGYVANQASAAIQSSQNRLPMAAGLLSPAVIPA